MSKKRTRTFTKTGVVKANIGAWIDVNVYDEIERRARASHRSINAEVEKILAEGVTHLEQQEPAK